ATANGMASIVAVNGTIVDLSGNAPTVTGYVETGRTYLDGSVQVGAMDGIVRDRMRMAMNGHIMVSVIMDEDDEALGEPWVDIKGLAEVGKSKAPLSEVLEEDLDQFIKRAGRKTRRDDKKLEDELRRIVRNTTNGEIGKKPEVTVMISRMY
ncbi:MAG: ribonuclease J, partial [Planktomarina sp.]